MIGGLFGLVRNDSKGIFIAREVVRQLNTDVASEANIADVIASVRKIVGN